MTRAKDLSKIVTDADLSGTLDVTGAFTSQGIDDNANATAITIDSSENVGIGTASPNSNGLHVEKSASNAMGVTISNTEGSGSRFDLYAFGSSPAVQSAHRNAIYQWTGNGIDLWSRVGDLHFGTNNTEKMRIDSNGNVGIGTTSLDLVGSTTSLTINNSGGNGQLSLMGNGTVYGRIFADNATGDLKMGNPTSNDFMFYTANLERMRITSAGNVGIGTDSPSFKVDIQGTDSQSILIKRTDANVVGGLQLQDFSTGGLIRTVGAKHLRFDTDSTERMQIDSSGNVHIGGTAENSASSFSFMTSGGDSYLNFNMDGRTSPITNSNGCYIWSGQGSTGDYLAGTLVLQSRSNQSRDIAFITGSSPTERMRINGSGNVGIGTNSPNTKMTVSTGVNSSTRTFLVDNAHSGGSMYNAFGVYVGDTDRLVTLSADYGESIMAFRTNGSERMRIDNSGSVLVGKTSVSDSTNGIQLRSLGDGTILGSTRTSGEACMLNRNGSSGTLALFKFQGSDCGTISVNTNSTAYNTSSDYRLKENVTADWDATTRLKQLNPVRFNFIADADTTVDGFLAHEVQSVVPEAITGTHNEVDADGNPVYQGIDQSKLVPLLVKTIQELEARIVALETA